MIGAIQGRAASVTPILAGELGINDAPGIDTGVGATQGREIGVAEISRRRINVRESATGRGPGGVGVAVENLSVAFGSRSVLRDLNLEIFPGEFVAVVGRSGCGKSTLLRVLAGLHAQDRGQVRIDGIAIEPGHVPVSEAPVRLMFQEPRLLPWKKVLANVALGLRGPDADARAREALAAVALADRAGDWPSVLSGGQRQRVALARALAHAPRLLLLDEPLGALDALTRLEMQGLIAGICRTRGLTVVLVTHDIQEAVVLADRVVILENGRWLDTIQIDVPHPRSAHLPELAVLQHTLLQRIVGESPESPETPVVAAKSSVNRL